MAFRQAQTFAHRAARTVDGRHMRKRRRRPLDRDRIAPDRRRLSPARDGERLAIDPRFEEPVDGIQEVVAVELRMKSQDAAAEEALEELVAPWTDRECFRIGPRNMPERDDRRSLQTLADHLRLKRKVLVMYLNDRISRL